MNRIQMIMDATVVKTMFDLAAGICEFDMEIARTSVTNTEIYFKEQVQDSEINRALFKAQYELVDKMKEVQEKLEPLVIKISSAAVKAKALLK